MNPFISLLFLGMASLLEASDAVAAFGSQRQSAFRRDVHVPWGLSRPQSVPKPSLDTTREDENFRTRPHGVRLHRADKSSVSLHASAARDAPDAPVRIIIAGAPASGKGTQCEIIKERFGVVHLSTGDLLREAVAAGTEVGKKAKKYMDSGKLVPDEIIIAVVKDRLAKADCQERGWLLDGFPRTKAQAQALADSDIVADCFIFLHVPDDVLVERVVGRRTDPKTGKIYHMTFSPPEDEEVAKRLVQRSDDTEEKVKVRLEQFHANVESVKDMYTDISVSIDGNKRPDDVSKAILDAIDSKLGAVCR